MADFTYSLEDLAYAAGIVDGEGYIGITRQARDKRRANSSPSYHAVVTVGMVDLEVPAWLAETFGGGLYSYPPRGASRRGVHHWRVTNAAAAEFCRAVRPFLRLKHRQAQLVLDYSSDERVRYAGRGPGSSVPAPVNAARENYATALKTLNRRTPA